MNYEEGIASLKSLIESASHLNRNEASTRFHLIDEIFFTCLGWEKKNCKVEESVETGFTDYSFYNPHRSLIVEAKREGTSFELPAGWDKIEYKLSTICKDNKQIALAIEQVIGYCAKNGTQFAAISNGFQIIAFLGSRLDGVPQLEGKAIVFDSLESMEKNFLHFWNLLSSYGIAQRNLLLRLSEKELVLPPPKLSSRISNYPGHTRRNTIQTDLQILSEVVLEDVVRNEEIESEFVRETYCSSGALSQYALVSKTILENRYSLLFENAEGPDMTPAMSKKGISKQIFAEGLSSRPILLIGDVGTGKTMFTKYLRTVGAPEIFEKSITMYIDLGSKAALTGDLRDFVLDEIQRILFDKYSLDIYDRGIVRGIYNLEIQRFSKSIHGELKQVDPSQYLIKELEFLDKKISNKSEHLKQTFESFSKSWKKQIVIFIDNVDQREMEFQEQAFLVANEISQNWPSTVFLTIRPSTFHRSKKFGALSGYHPKAFSISPPRVDDVLMKRINFSLNICRGELSLSKFQQDIRVNLDTLHHFLEILKSSIENNHALREFLDNICYGNIRLAIEYLTVFIGSGHIDTKKILSIDDQNLEDDRYRYQISLHEFLRAIIFRENQYYDSETTTILNLFDISQNDSKEHFLQPMILDFFIRNSSIAGQEGFLETKIFIEHFQNLGYNYEQIKHSLLRLLSKDLIDSTTRDVYEGNESLPDYVRITTIGSYHIKRLITEFTYVDSMIVDTPIVLQPFRDVINDDHDIFRRIERCSKFLEYLNRAWGDYGQDSEVFDWPGISEAIVINMKKAKTGASKRLAN